VILSPLGTSANIWSVIPGPDDGESVVWLARETEVHWENMPQCHFVFHKSNTVYIGVEPGQDTNLNITMHMLHCTVLTAHIYKA
jgi:hypothetical protein